MQKKNKKISIILPTYNGSKCIKKSIESVLNQIYTNFELIIVNDASTDNTLDIISDYAKKDNRIKIINNDVNKKLPASLNVGFREASGDYLTWTSDDNKYYKDALFIMADELNNNPNIDMVYADFNRVNLNGEIIVVEKLYEPDYLKYHNTIGACFLYRREMYIKIGEYDENLFLAEDYDYWLRMYLNGNLMHINKVLYDYGVHENSLSNKRLKDVVKATIKVKKKHEEDLIKTCKNKDERIDYYLTMLSHTEDDKVLFNEMKKEYIDRDFDFKLYSFKESIKNSINSIKSFIKKIIKKMLFIKAL